MRDGFKMCGCAHEFQDQTHGKNVRVASESKDGMIRCSVCSGPTRKIERVRQHAAQMVLVNGTNPALMPSTKARVISRTGTYNVEISVSA